MDDFKELYPTKSALLDGDDFSPMFKKPLGVDFKESYSLRGEVVVNDGEQIANDGESLLADMEWDSTLAVGQNTNLSDRESMQSAWDDGYASGVTESGLIEASKYADQIERIKKGFKKSLDGIIFTVGDIELSENIITLFQKYCNDVSSKVFGDEISDQLSEFIIDKVDKFSAEIRASNLSVEVTVSPQNFDNLKSIGCDSDGGEIMLSSNCSVKSSGAIGDDELCRVVADIDDNLIKADLNLSAVKQELVDAASVLDVPVADAHTPEQEVKPMPNNSKMSALNKDAMMKKMSNTLNGFDLDDIPDIAGGYGGKDGGLV